MDFNKRILSMDEDLDAEDEVIRFKRMPTLQHLAAVKGVTTIWKNVSAECVHWDAFDKNRYDNFFSDVLPRQVQNLGLRREVINSHVMFVVKGLNYELDLWIAFHTLFRQPFEPYKHLPSIQWTFRGRVDYTRTAESLLSDNTLSPRLKSVLQILYKKSANKQRLHAVYSRWDFIFDTPFGVPNRFPRNSFSWGDMFKFLIDFFERYQGIFFRHSVNSPEALGYSPVDDYLLILSQMSIKDQKEQFPHNPILKMIYLSEDWLWRDYFIPILDKKIEDVEDYFYELVAAVADCYAVGYFPEWHRGCLAEILDVHFDLFQEINFNSKRPCYSLLEFIYSLRVDKLYQSLYIDILDVVFASQAFRYKYLSHFQRNVGELTPENMIQEMSHSRVIYDSLPQVDHLRVKFHLAYPSMTSYLLSEIFHKNDILQAENTCYFFPQNLKVQFMECIILAPEFTEESYKLLLSRQFELYTKILDFVFCGRQEEITAYKNKKLINEDYIFDEQFLIAFKAAKLYQPWEVLKSILEFCFEDKSNFKERHPSEKKLDYQEKLLSIIDFFFGVRFELAVAFFNWWFDSDSDKDTIQLVKRDYFLCYHIRNTLKTELLLRDKVESDTPQIISPSYFTILSNMNFFYYFSPIRQKSYPKLVDWVQPNSELMRFIEEPIAKQ